MNHTQAQILTKAHSVLKDLYQQFYKAEEVEKCWFVEKERALHFHSFEEAIWIVSINDPVFGKTEFLTLSDETGEPLYLQSSMVSGSEIVLGDDLKYTYKPIEQRPKSYKGTEKYVHKKKTQTKHRR